MNKKFIITLIISIAVCLSIGALGGLSVKADNFVWYNSLNRSPLNPPNILFPIAWGILYILLAVSITLVINKKPVNKQAVIIFIIQLLLNSFWTFIFFGLKQPLFGLIEIIILDIMIIINIIKFKPISKAASILLIPYLAWCLFASYLTLYVVMFN
ncbi:TspO/MBR family protein [Brachyspira murdochii]|uniref:TspO and MBR like protein n=1 Tax=Brachyspira murdochii (strain ATCC 51284 / DSM 12563 / 56-150) TaxID=526224 RepID=D5U8M3_BRAM5|nr:TspO/MBR family protein [Brachyspira murdochii]ADG71046.1 TspO and MBR like protein [Brachyspira murdochii DSM 12563]